MLEKLKVVIVGVTGYGGIELLRLLREHPNVEVTQVYAHSQGERQLSSIYPHLTGLWDIKVKTFDIENIVNGVEEIQSDAGLVFMATPSGVSARLTPALLEAGMPVIDMSGDLRLADPDTYRQWYGHEPAPADVLKKAVYGLTEIYRESIWQAAVIANPGCFPTTALLGLAPLLKERLIDNSFVVIDAKTGVSGAGRSSKLMHSFSEISENLQVYKMGQHQHIPEIERFASEIMEEQVKISLTTHLVPMVRGMMSTIYVQPRIPVTSADIQSLYESFYEEECFVRIRPQGTWPQTKEVCGSNFCDIAAMVDQRTERMTVVSVIDNLVKGAAGQAVQNLNVRMGWPEETGLKQVPLYP